MGLIIEVIPCKECKFFEYDRMESVNGFPLIIAHEVCTRIAGGIKTKADGYCFMAERSGGDEKP